MVFERAVPCLSPRDIFIQYLSRALREILQQVSNGIENDCISFRLEQIIEVLLRSTSVFQDGGQLLSVLRRALVIVQGPPEVASTAPTPLLYSGAKGRPRVEIQPEALKFLLEFGFKDGEIATMFCVSIRTIQRRMANFNIREDVPRYTPISDNQLDETCRQITSEFPNCGVRRMRSFLGHSLTSICAIFRHSLTSICTLTTTGSKKTNSFVEERGNSMRLTIARLFCHFV